MKLLDVPRRTPLFVAPGVVQTVPTPASCYESRLSQNDCMQLFA
jgi:hypothetical protein